jgi:nucleotide-binding universal stress UspA family protein
MKNFIVPVDFTPSSLAAVKFASLLSKKISCPFTLLHVYRIPLAPEIPAMLINEKDAKAEVENLIHKNYSKLLTGFNYKTEIQFSYDFVGTTLKMAKKHKSDFILIGKSKSSHIEKIIFGNHLSLLMKDSNIPVIAIPEGNKINDIKRISLTTKLEGLNSKKHLSFIKEIAGACSAEINITHVTPYIRDHQDRIELHKSLENVSKKIAYSKTTLSLLENNSALKGIEAHIEHKSIQMVAILFHKHNLIETIFAPNNSKSIATNIQKPLLVLPD